GALRVGLRLLDVLHAADQQAGGGDGVSARLDLDADGAACRRRQPRGRLDQQRAEAAEIVARRARAIRVRDAAAQVHRLDVGELRERVRDQLDEAAQVVIELAYVRAGADVGVQLDDRQLGRLGALAQRQQVLVPDAVLRRRTAGVTRLHVAVAEARVHAYCDRSAVPGAAQLVDHGG